MGDEPPINTYADSGKAKDEPAPSNEDVQVGAPSAESDPNSRIENVEAARPCIERLRLIAQTERVIGTLEDEYYGQTIVDGVSKLRKNDISSALRVLEEFKDLSLFKYKRILQREIANHLQIVAIQRIHRFEYSQAFQTISELKGHQKDWGFSDNSHLITIRHLAGSHIKNKAVTHIEAGEYTQAVALLHFLDVDHLMITG